MALAWVTDTPTPGLATALHNWAGETAGEASPEHAAVG